MAGEERPIEPADAVPTPNIVQETERLGEMTDTDQRMRTQYEIFQKLDKLGRALMVEHYPDSAEVYARQMVRHSAARRLAPGPDAVGFRTSAFGGQQRARRPRSPPSTQ